MLKLSKIYEMCDGLEVCDRATGIKKLAQRGINESNAIKYYNIWRRHYMETSRKDLCLSQIYINVGDKSKLLEECPFKERQKYLEALDKPQLIQITQAMLK